MILGLLLLAFATCNNEPPECAPGQYPPLRCQLSVKSGRKIDSAIIYMPKLDSVLFKGSTLPSIISVPLDATGDTTMVQFTIIGITKTNTETYSSFIGVASQPELNIVNLSCGAFYIFRDLDYSMKSVIGKQPTYKFDTVYIKAVDSVPYVKYDTSYSFSSDNAKLEINIDTIRGWNKHETTYMYIDTIKTGVETVYIPTAIDSIHYFTDEIDQDYETHAEIFF
jgi:hypothetical protein